ncbi:MAG: type IV pilus assembly protein PilM [Candidatus Obscuribacterales bacterium]|nr:type IV pilus assembly protein PilM [Candidatus Obscuribacterales bacterium]
MFGFGKKAGPTIGLDINSSTISVLQLEKTKTSDIKVSKFASTLTPPEIVREGLLADPEAVGTAVRELLDSAGLVAKGPAPIANIGIPGQSVVIRLMPVPKGMPNDELNDVVRQEAINNLPFPIDEANLDWARVPGTVRTDPDGVEREDILLGAIQRIIVDGYFRMAEIAGIQIGKLEISSLAAVRALANSGQLGEDALSLVVNIRQDATDITLVNKAVPLFSRSVLLGVETIMESMQRSINATAEEAKELLPRIQLLGVPTVEPRLGQAAQVARSVCGDLTAEVGRSLEFYMSQVGMVRVDQVLVCGPGTSIPEIDQFIANRLNLNATVANPLQGIVYDRAQIIDSMRPHHTMLMGLVAEPEALKGKTVGINLNQGERTEGEYEEGEEEEVEEIDTPWFKPALIAGSVIAALVVGAWGFVQFAVIPGKDAELAQLEGEITDGKTKLAAMDKAQAAMPALEQTKTDLSDKLNRGTPTAVLLQTLRDQVPQGLGIVNIALKGSNVSIGGNSSDFSKVSHLAINLSGSNKFSNVEMGSVKRFYNKPELIYFRLNGTLSPDLSKQTLSSKNNQAESAPPAADAANAAPAQTANSAESK